MSKSDGIKNWRKRTKQFLVDGFGGKCNKCRLQYNIEVFGFHHLDKKKKRMSISEMLTCPKKITEIIKEIKKCILLCKNCHTQLHAGNWLISDIKIIKFHGKHVPLIKKKKKEYLFCLKCNEKYLKTHKNHKFCSYKCSYLSHRKVENRPTKLQLKNAIQYYPKHRRSKYWGWTILSKKYGVCGEAIKKWAKEYNLIQ